MGVRKALMASGVGMVWAARAGRLDERSEQSSIEELNEPECDGRVLNLASPTWSRALSGERQRERIAVLCFSSEL